MISSIIRFWGEALSSRQGTAGNGENPVEEKRKPAEREWWRIGRQAAFFLMIPVLLPNSSMNVPFRQQDAPSSGQQLKKTLLRTVNVSQS